MGKDLDYAWSDRICAYIFLFLGFAVVAYVVMSYLIYFGLDKAGDMDVLMILVDIPVWLIIYALINHLLIKRYVPIKIIFIFEGLLLLLTVIGITALFMNNRAIPFHPIFTDMLLSIFEWMHNL